MQSRKLTGGAGEIAGGAQPTCPSGVNDGRCHKVVLLAGAGKQEWRLHTTLTVGMKER